MLSRPSPGHSAVILLLLQRQRHLGGQEEPRDTGGPGGNFRSSRAKVVRICLLLKLFFFHTQNRNFLI